MLLITETLKIWPLDLLKCSDWINVFVLTVHKKEVFLQCNNYVSMYIPLSKAETLCTLNVYKLILSRHMNSCHRSTNCIILINLSYFTNNLFKINYFLPFAIWIFFYFWSTIIVVSFFKINVNINNFWWFIIDVVPLVNHTRFQLQSFF